MAAAALPAFHRFSADGTGEQPPLAAYLPAAVDATRCVGRRTDEDHCDRRWAPFVYAAYQCKSMPVAAGAGDLCEVCRRREAKGTAKDNWHGRVTGDVPADSHIAGSTWFHTKAKWVGDEKPKTRRMEERAPERRLVADVEIRRFLAGTVPLNIERLSADNQLTGQQLRDMVCRLSGKPVGADRVNGHDTKEKLCELIRKLLDPTHNPKPKFTFHYPKAEGSAASVASGGASGGAGSAPASVSSAEDDATAAELVAKDAEIAELRAQLAALQSKLSKVVLALSGADDE
jgi:hypothetical protein